MSTLKGKTVIELKDNNGNIETYESENMITNAVPNIFKKNPFGWVRYSEFTPLQWMFGSILLFENTLTEDANNTIPTQSPMGWAGSLVNAGTFTKRGSPNFIETGEISNGFKYVWDFTTSQANGTISAVGLSHATTGNSDHIDMLMNPERYKICYNGGATWYWDVEADIGKYNNIIAVDGEYCYSVDLSECTNPLTKLTIYKCRKSINSFSLNTDEYAYRPSARPTFKPNYNDEKTKFDYTFSTPFETINNAYENHNTNIVSISEYNGFIYLIQKTTTANQVRIVKIDYKNNTFTDRNITIPSTIKNFESCYSSDRYYVTRDIFLIDNNEIYFPCTNGNMYSLNLSTDVSTLRYSTNYTIPEYGGLNFKTTREDGSSVLISYRYGLNSTFNIVTNTGVIENISEDSWDIFSSGGLADIIFKNGDNNNKDAIVYLGNGYYYNSYNRLLWLDSYYLATINNLDTPVTKTSAQTMKITYTLTYV